MNKLNTVRPTLYNHMVRIAVEGCCHGELDQIYASIKLTEEKQNIKVDLVIICGDFQVCFYCCFVSKQSKHLVQQALRDESDQAAIACPQKYIKLGTFHKYYNGTAVAPYPTLFIGGNHEASNYLWELYCVSLGILLLRTLM